MNRSQTIRRWGHMVVVALLLGATIATGWALSAAFRLWREKEDLGDRDALGRLAWVLLGILGVLLILLCWAVFRWMAAHLQMGSRRKPSQYVDAWAEAGRRLQVPSEEPRRIDVDPVSERPAGDSEAVPDESAAEYLEYTPEYHEGLENEEDDELWEEGSDEEDEFDDDDSDDDLDPPLR